jgi:hypothetical protein
MLLLLSVTGNGILTANAMWLTGVDWNEMGVVSRLRMSGSRLPYGEEVRFLCSGASKLGRTKFDLVCASAVLLQGSKTGGAECLPRLGCAAVG